MPINNINNPLHNIERPNNHFKQITQKKKSGLEEVNNSAFQKLLTSNQSANNSSVKPPVSTKSDFNNIYNSAKKIKTENDIDFNLKKLSEEMVQQTLGTMWNLAFASIDKEPEGGIAEEMFHKELINEIVKLSKNGEMGNLAQNIYDDLKRKKENVAR